MRRAFASLILAGLVATGGPAQSQGETLADIRQELSVLYVEVQRLKRELSTTGSATTSLGFGGALERLDLIESELRRLIAKSEELEFRIDRVVTDGTNRIGDLEFRLCELEANCDIASLGETPSLGGEAPATVVTPPPPSNGGPELAVGEQADFDQASAQLQAGDYAAAAAAFDTFTDNYAGSPLTSDAHFFRGEALRRDGQVSKAARAYLQSFSGSPNGGRAAEALYRLGVSLGDLGQVNEACVTLGEVGIRFPTSPIVPQADDAMDALGCV